MPAWFYRGLRRGIATTRYPKTVDPWTRELMTPPAFHSAGLTPQLADQLVRVCPSQAITRDGSELILDLGGCTGCGCCLELDAEVVRPSGEFLLACRDRSALIKRVEIGGSQEARDVRR